jgi:uncharacterized membrane protein YhaH (DUF805 family)
LKNLLSFYLVIAVIATQFFAAYFYSKSRTSYRKAFSALVLCVSIYLFGYLMIINNNNLQEMIFWNQIQYLGLPFISVLWLMVALLYTKILHSYIHRNSCRKHNDHCRGKDADISKPCCVLFHAINHA